MHTRDHRSVLAASEKRLLVALARRLPALITSDHLTLIGIIGMLLAGVFFACIPAAPWSAAAFVAALALNWFGDSLDGTVARVRNQQRPRYGYYVDHVLDLAGTAALIGGIGASGLMRPWIAFALAAAFFLLAAERFLATHARGIFRLSFAWFGPTELRIVLAIGAVVATRNPSVHVLGTHTTLFDIGGLVAAAGMVVAFAVAAVQNTRALYSAEPLPPPPNPSQRPRVLELANVAEGAH